MHWDEACDDEQIMAYFFSHVATASWFPPQIEMATWTQRQGDRTAGMTPHRQIPAKNTVLRGSVSDTGTPRRWRLSTRGYAIHRVSFYVPPLSPFPSPFPDTSRCPREFQQITLVLCTNVRMKMTPSQHNSFQEQVAKLKERYSKSHFPL